MRLSVPCNWDPALPELLADIPGVYELTGAMNVTPVGGGRPAMITRDVNQTQVAQTVWAAHANGWEFCYLLNAPCMGNMEYDVTVHGDLLRHLDWLAETGVDTIAVSIPYLIELIKTRHPAIKVRVSLIAHVNTVSTARYFQGLGADSITVDYMKNRDEPFLRALKKNAPGDYALLVNDQCLLHCPYRSYHYNACGHGSQSFDPQSNYYLDYSMVRCSIDKLTRPERLVMMPWIRPEDLSVYEAIGFSTFKLSGRHMATDAI
ncbi:MAG: U32 family peptidase, partial [Deltaproteobacteria bacterium]|nr:U32 family peptidase [Deltaproteobacteria bacterium]